MKWNRSLALIASFLLVTATLCACSAQPSEKGADVITVRVVATRNFGQELMFDEMLEVLPDASAMSALMKVAEVETTYGGGFVNAINDVRSGYTGKEKTKTDWFIYVNGIRSNTGALDYKLRDGDTQHWDFHNWSFHHFIPAIMGDFPEPFRHGYGGNIRSTIIAYADSLKEDAENLERRLTQLGVSNVSAKRTDELSENEKESSNLILLGTMDNAFISELNQNWKRLGFFTYFENGNLVVLDAEGEVAAKYSSGAGLIQATQNPWNPNGIGACENVLWMVSGTDEAGVKDALDALVNHHIELQYACAAIVVNGEIIKVPNVKSKI
jgi:hypothetical protein